MIKYESILFSQTDEGGGVRCLDGVGLSGDIESKEKCEGICWMDGTRRERRKRDTDHTLCSSKQEKGLEYWLMLADGVHKPAGHMLIFIDFHDRVGAVPKQGVYGC